MSELKLLSKEVVNKKNGKIRIMQFGEGNFLRAFVDWMIQKMNDSGEYDGHVVVVQPLENGRIKELQDQDGLYTLILQGINENGEAVKTHQVIDVLDDFVNPYTEFSKFLKYAESKDLEVIISNTTEAGIVFEPKDVTCDLNYQTPISYPGKLLALLKRRYITLGKDVGFAILPCELIDDNGDKLKEVVLRLARERRESAGFIEYIEKTCHFTSSLVDRIVPGFPRDEFKELCEEYGYIDNNMVKGEYFNLYVLKKEEYIQKVFPVDKFKCNAIYVDDVHPYKQRKVRILNGTHTALVPVAYLAGCNEVRESLLNETIGEFISNLMNNEITPTVTTSDALEFANAVKNRFLNPYVHHALMSIALNSLSKFKERDLPTLLDNIKAGKTPTHLLFSLACLIKFYFGYRVVNGTKEEIKLSDNQAYLNFFKVVKEEYEENKDLKEVTKLVLGNFDIWDKDLSKEPVIFEKVHEYLEELFANENTLEVVKEFNLHE